MKLVFMPIYLEIILNSDHGNSYKCKVTYVEILDLNDFVIQKEEFGFYMIYMQLFAFLGQMK